MFRHIAFYKFTPITQLPRFRAELLEWLRAHNLFGTILLAEEGMNGGLAGEPDSIRAFEDFLRSDLRFQDIVLKMNEVKSLPYKRRMVKIKKEIVTMGLPEMSPPVAAPRLPPQELYRWLEENRDFTLLDTRNDYEYSLGSFERAKAAGVAHFRHFPKKAKDFPTEWRKKPVVTFCTGGIRCEKAAPYLQSLGYENVYQLDGGILRYFQEMGGKHWRGDCFVFDERVAVGPDLRATGAAICPSCQKILEKQLSGICPDCV